jgi:branched-chain amino acid transport system permease protein
MDAFALQLTVQGIALGSGYALTAVGLTLIFGVLGVINFAHGEFYMLGAFVGYSLITGLGLNYFVAIPLTIVAIGGLGALVEYVLLRPIAGRGEFPTLMLTFGLGIFLLNVAQVVWGADPTRIPTPLSEGVKLGPATLAQQWLLVALVAGATIVALALIVQYSAWGRSLRATAQNPLGAAYTGINVRLVHASTFALGVSLAGLAGLLVGPIAPLDPSVGQIVVVNAFIIVILGGLGSFRGAVVGGLLLGLVEAFASGYLSGTWATAIGWSIVILILLFRPSGLFGRALGEGRAA